MEKFAFKGTDEREEMFMNVIVALIPALLWGLVPLLVVKIGGEPIQQQLGTAFGCGIFAVAIYAITRPETAHSVILGCIISGIGWSVGQLMQYNAYRILGTSTGFALSISFEMVLNALVAVLVLREWNSMFQVCLGSTAIAAVVIGGWLTVYTEQKEPRDLKKGIVVLLVGACGLVTWNVAVRMVNASGLSAVLPQAVGMVMGSLILCFFVRDRSVKKFDKITFKQILPGLAYACANFGLIFSNLLNGVAIGYTTAQLSLAVQTVLALTVFHEKRTRNELIHSISGVILITVGCMMIGFT